MNLPQVTDEQIEKLHDRSYSEWCDAGRIGSFAVRFSRAILSLSAPAETYPDVALCPACLTEVQKAAPQEAKPVTADSWKLVPIEPTSKMRKAGQSAELDLDQDKFLEKELPYQAAWTRIWPAMIAAVPQEQAPADNRVAKDAARYRYLRNPASDGFFANLYLEDLDAEIDAAMQSQPQQVM